MSQLDSVSDSLNSPAVPWLHPQAAYIHIPFCAHHCGYCDFAIAVNQDDLMDRYLDALAEEMAREGRPLPVKTIFIGGGTPTLLNPIQLDRLLALLNSRLPAAQNYPGREISIEANPATLTKEKIDVLADHGVNRVSLGAQSFQWPLLKVLERDHEPPDVARAIDLVRRRIENVSIDLIFAVPGQTLAQWSDDLLQALALAPSHISTYGLTFEKGTPLWKARERGEVSSLPEDLELALYDKAIDTLEAAGLEHYEISNFAVPGRRCRHNQVYWANHAYWGFGMGATRYVMGHRQTNTRSLAGYIQKAQAGQSTAFQAEELDPEARARETIAQNLRRVEGIHRPEFRNQTGFHLDALAGGLIEKFIAQGLMKDNEDSVFLARQGKYVADSVIGEFLTATPSAG